MKYLPIIILIVLIVYCFKCNNEGFTNNNKIEKIYVISLKGKKNRLDKFMTRAKKANVKVERFDAINGNNLSKNHPDINKYFVTNHNLTRSNWLCFESY